MLGHLSFSTLNLLNSTQDFTISFIFQTYA